MRNRHVAVRTAGHTLCRTPAQVTDVRPPHRRWQSPRPGDGGDGVAAPARTELVPSLAWTRVGYWKPLRKMKPLW